MLVGGETRETFQTGTLAGAGCFRCQACGFAAALHECDEVPECPHCGGRDFRRASIFGEHALREPAAMPVVDAPAWIEDARGAIDAPGSYVAFDEDGRLRMVALPSGWTRIGRSLSADVRFDDPTVSRRHALVHVQDGVVRILDDRSLNGVFVNGERIDLRELADRDELTIGRFRLYFIRVEGEASGDVPSGAREPAHL